MALEELMKTLTTPLSDFGSLARWLCRPWKLPEKAQLKAALAGEEC